MTEAEWLACTDPIPMLDFVTGKATDRKLRLFACSCCRHAWDLLSSEDRTIVALVEQCVDGHFNLEDVRRQLRVQCPNSLFEPWDQSDWRWFRQRLREQDPEWLDDDELSEIEQEGGWFPEILFLPNAGCSARITAQGMRGWKEEKITPDRSLRKPDKRGDLQAWQVAWEEVQAAWEEVYEAFETARGAARETELVWQVAVLQDLFGKLYWPVTLDSAWLSWNGATVPRLARCIYEERRFGDMPILGDALEEAGCTSCEIVQHCRLPGEHVRGCWLVDLILGKK
jgi:hypothetical protein